MLPSISSLFFFFQGETFGERALTTRRRRQSETQRQYGLLCLSNPLRERVYERSNIALNMNFHVYFVGTLHVCTSKAQALELISHRAHAKRRVFTQLKPQRPEGDFPNPHHVTIQYPSRDEVMWGVQAWRRGVCPKAVPADSHARPKKNPAVLRFVSGVRNALS